MTASVRRHESARGPGLADSHRCHAPACLDCQRARSGGLTSLSFAPQHESPSLGPVYMTIVQTAVLIRTRDDSFT